MTAYSTPMQYIHDPLGIFKFWEGGLSSHGGVVGILIGISVFCTNVRKTYPMLTWVAMLDLLSIPALLAGGFIRIGNFFNQEIIGTVTNVPWAVIFGDPADGSSVAPRHPVQLYEAGGYLLIFVSLYVLYFKVLGSRNMMSGKVFFSFLITTSIARAALEFFRAEPHTILFWPTATIVSLIVAGASLFALYYFQIRNIRTDISNVSGALFGINSTIFRKFKF